MIQSESIKSNNTNIVFDHMIEEQKKIKFKLMKDNLSQSIPSRTSVPIHGRLKDKFSNIQESVIGFGLIIAKGTVLA